MTKEIYKPRVGQTLYSLNIGNAARSCEQILVPVIVTKVGRKYFSCAKLGYLTETQYYIESWRQVTDYSSTSALYSDPQERADELERIRLMKIIMGVFESQGKYDLSLDQLRYINNIINNT